MNKNDLRKQTKEVRDYARLQAIRMLKQGKTKVEIASLLGAHPVTVSRWYLQHQQKGRKALKERKRGVKAGQGRVLTNHQETEIKKMIVDKTPDQLKLPFVLWDRKAVKELIQRQYGVTVAIRTVGDYLLRWNFTPQRPAKQAYEQQPKAVQRWLDEEYPKIQNRARQEQAEIHWGDETGFRNDHHYGRGYAPKGKTPIIRLPAERVSSNMISTVSNQGKVRFMIYSEKMNAKVLIRFLKRLIKVSDQKVFLILDNLRVHHAILVREWLEGKEDEIELFFLPSYSPELNPDEYLNNDIKQGIHSKELFRDEESLKKSILSHMRMLQKTPARVLKYFKHPKIDYAL